MKNIAAAPAGGAPDRAGAPDDGRHGVLRLDATSRRRLSPAPITGPAVVATPAFSLPAGPPSCRNKMANFDEIPAKMCSPA